VTSRTKGEEEVLFGRLEDTHVVEGQTHVTGHE